MRTCLLLLVLLLATSSLAFANSIGLYADTEGINCWLYDSGDGPLTFYAVAIVSSGTVGVQFSAPQPACMVGTTYLGDDIVFPKTIGNSQYDVAIAFDACLTTPVHVLTINYYGTGQSTTCCEYPVLAGANDPNIGPSSVDCSNNVQQVGGYFITVNPNDLCLCIVPTESSTWGTIKALYH
jgi:hypothetical protein